MADKYYWIKLRNTFLTSRAVDFLMSQPNGANYVVLYQCLCLNTINTNGELASAIGEMIVPYDIPKIQRDCKWFSEDTVRVALALYEKLGLVYVQENGILKINDFERMVGNETKWAEYKRIAREKDKLLIGQCPTNVQQDIRDKSIRDLENKNIEKKKKESKDDALAEPPFITLPAIRNDFLVTTEYLEELKATYPAVDVEQELREMKMWLDSNPSNKKVNTKSFITRWLGKEQDKGRVKPTQTTPNKDGVTEEEWRAIFK